MRFVECTFEREGAAILAILNDVIATSTALYDYAPRTLDDMRRWFAAKDAGNFPVIGLLDAAGELAGFGSYGTFRAWPAYKYTVEHSIYLHRAHRGAGLGTPLLQAVVARAHAQGYHTLVGAIDAGNAASIALHLKLGFTHAGTIRHAGFKFGRWLDAAFYQLILDTPADPRDG
jgi:phosphinothricin acetyltransferase